jgi:hypothetical protein
MSKSEFRSRQSNRRLSVTDHAIWRYLERINPTEPFPADRIRERFEIAESISIAGYDLSARLDDSGDVVFLFDANAHEVITLFEASPTQREYDIQPESSPSAGWKATYQAMGVDQ